MAGQRLRILAAIALTITTLAVTHVAAQSERAAARDSANSRQILIAKGNSYLETVVARIVQDTLTQRGFVVKTVDIARLQDLDPGSFRALIFFNAVKASSLDNQVRGFLSGLDNDKSNVLICTVTGERWSTKKASADAVAAATTMMKPGKIAARVLKYVDTITAAK